MVYPQVENRCNKCGAPMAFSMQGKPYCSAKCWLPKTQPYGSPAQNQVVPQASSVVLNKVEKPHSYEFGPANNRHKIYYAEIAELLEHVEQLKNAGLTEETTLENGQD